LEFGRPKTLKVILFQGQDLLRYYFKRINGGAKRRNKIMRLRTDIFNFAGEGRLEASFLLGVLLVLDERASPPYGTMQKLAPQRCHGMGVLVRLMRFTGVLPRTI